MLTTLHVEYCNKKPVHDALGLVLAASLFTRRTSKLLLEDTSPATSRSLDEGMKSFFTGGPLNCTELSGVSWTKLVPFRPLWRKSDVIKGDTVEEGGILVHTDDYHNGKETHQLLRWCQARNYKLTTLGMQALILILILMKCC